MKNTFKTFNPTDCIIHDTRIDIWQYPLHTEFSEAKDLLNEEESIRAKRYHFARHQRRFTVARAVLRLILARYLRQAATEIKFTFNQYGKPQILNSSLQFNLSHSGEFALLAVGNNFPLGIDLEFFSARPYEGIGKQLFSTSENLALQNIPLNLKPFVFFHIWAQKEAFIKACGLGLSYPTKDFDVPVLPGKSSKINDSLHNKMWEMASFMPQVACSAALCYHPEIEEIRYLSLNEVNMNYLSLEK